MCDTAVEYITGQQRQAAMEMIDLLQNSSCPQKVIFQLMENDDDLNNTSNNNKFIKIAYDSLQENHMRSISTRNQFLSCQTNQQTKNNIKKQFRYEQKRQLVKLRVVSKYYSQRLHKNGCHCGLYKDFFIALGFFLLVYTVIACFGLYIELYTNACKLDTSNVHTQFLIQVRRITLKDLYYHQNLLPYQVPQLQLLVNRQDIFYCRMFYYYVSGLPFAYPLILFGEFLLLVCVICSKRFRTFIKGFNRWQQQLKSNDGKLKLIQPSYSSITKSSTFRRTFRLNNNY